MMTTTTTPPRHALSCAVLLLSMGTVGCKGGKQQPQAADDAGNAPAGEQVQPLQEGVRQDVPVGTEAEVDPTEAGRSEPGRAVGVSANDEPTTRTSGPISRKTHPDADDETTLSEEEFLHRKASTSSAKVGTSMLLDYAVGNTFEGVGSVCELSSTGSQDFTPPLSVACHRGPKGCCVAVEPPQDPQHPWEYSISAWETPAWQKAASNRQPDPSHDHIHPFIGRMNDPYHYRLDWYTETTEHKTRCVVTATAVGDLDGDGIMSKFTATSLTLEQLQNDAPSRARENEYE